ncbi:MAG: chondroitinase family polysaccharide lyase [Bacteroidales bacterium]
MNYRKNLNKKSLLIAGVYAMTALGCYAHDFESSSVPSTLKVEAGTLSLSKKHYKDGLQSLNWNWDNGPSVLSFTDADIKSIVSSFDNRSGIKCWIYNETPLDKPLKFNFLDEQGRVQYTFDFHMNFTGWRAAWIAYKDMWTPAGESPVKKYVSVLNIQSPEGVQKGDIYIDRLQFVSQVDRQATPDAQIPENNRHIGREIWHWGLLHKWNTQPYDLPLVAPTAQEQKEMQSIVTAIKGVVKGKTLSASDRTTLDNLVKTVKLTPEGKGAPLMQNDNVRSGDVNFTQLNKLLDLSARGWYIDKNEADKQTFISAVKYALDQGFAYESGMGTNHHYGYNTRELYGAIWWMQDILTDNNLWEDAYKMVSYWSGLAECRQPFNVLRDEITDSWNTLILPKLACASMHTDEQERLRELRGLSRWVSGSLRITPGTIGGIKVDGTIFHHGGHYPAYGVPGLAYLGRYLSCVNATSFTITDEAREVMKLALEASRNYSNLRSWGLGICGRNPFNGEISSMGATAFGYAAQAGTYMDKDLAADFMRIKEGQKLYTADINMNKAFTAAGVTKATAPQGFYVFNYANHGTYRYKDQMVSLKGMSNILWGSEIYAENNRFGRYQSYGSVLIIGTPSPQAIEGAYPVSEQASRFVENGWNWNRVPGATTIHLPWDKLNSPASGDFMLRQRERFAGTSSLEGRYGMFAMKLGEMGFTNFTGDFRARKSVFCAGNKLVCLGSDIYNTNQSAPTETTLFQQALLQTSEVVEVNGTKETGFPYSANLPVSENQILKDLTGNYYYIPRGQEVLVNKSTQNSRENKKMANTSGDFAVAYLNHGVAPQDKSYEYMILLEADPQQADDCKKGNTGYEVLEHSKAAHAVHFPLEHIRAYSLFDAWNNPDDAYLMEGDAETMVMLRENGDELVMSICSPDINQTKYEYTNAQESQPVQRSIVLKGEWEMNNKLAGLTVSAANGMTTVTATCQHGQPVEFTLSPVATSNEEIGTEEKVSIYRSGNDIVVKGEAATVEVYDFQGRQIRRENKESGESRYSTNHFPVIVRVITPQNQTSKKVM